jgi:selenide,water dikinase
MVRRGQNGTKMQATSPLLRDLVFLGGGHAHALALRMSGMRPLAGVRLTLVNPEPVTPYTGMLPGHIAGHYRRDEMMIDLVRLCRFAGARLILDRATGIDRQARMVQLAEGPPLAYDLLSLDIGIGSGLPDLQGFAAQTLPVKPLGPFAAEWQAFLARDLPEPRVVLVGAGLGGVELALAVQHRLQAMGRTPQVTLLEQAATILPDQPEPLRRRLLAALARAGVAVITAAEPAAAEAGAVVLTRGRRIASDFTLTVARGQAAGWLAGLGLVHRDGFLSVGATLQTSDPLIFAAGDCAHLAHAPRPKAGVFAVRAAPVLFDTLRASLTGAPLRAFHPQRDYLKLVSLGDRTALADKFGLRAQGAALWRWKDRIDRRFMAMFQDYPVMRVPAPPGPQITGLAAALAEKPLCGGCGSKVGPGALSLALQGLPPGGRRDVLSGPGDDAAVLEIGGARQVLTTDHLRAFTEDPRRMARIAATHALGDVWAMGAAPQVALSQIILPQMAPELQARTLREISEAAGAVFSAAGAEIVGGHSTMGAEMTLGFTVTGLVDRPIDKGGAQPGDALILTKPLGTGVILAAAMANVALPGGLLGEVVAAAWAAMERPLGPAAAVLKAAHAMTDVTGFGLAGHLVEMLAASGVSAKLRLADLPLLQGALDLAELGQASSLAPANRAALAGRVSLPEGPLADLLFDPQTGGGLLAAVPAAEAPALVASLRELGEVAAVIGEVTAGPVFLTVE